MSDVIEMTPTHYDEDERIQVHPQSQSQGDDGSIMTTDNVSVNSKRPLNKSFYRQDGNGERAVEDEESQVAAIGNPTKALTARWILMTVNAILTILIFALYMGFIGGFIQIIILGTLLIAMLAYIPASMVLTANNKSTGFQAAYVEIGYLVLQQIGWFASGALSLRAATTPSQRANQHNESNTIDGSLFSASQTSSWVAYTTCALSFIHFMMLFGWMVWVIVKTKRSGRAWKVSVNRILRG